MRLLFEISHMRNASPATASRGGVLFLNEADVGWQPFKSTFFDQMGDRLEPRAKTTLEHLFDTHVPTALEWLRRNKARHITPVADLAMVEMACRLLEGLLTPESLRPADADEAAGEESKRAGEERGQEHEKRACEVYFNLAAVWAFGGALDSGKGADWRKQFSDFWTKEVAPKTSVRFPDEGLVFDYTVEAGTCRFVHWRERVPGYTHVRDAPFATIVVPTIDTTRLGAWIELLSRRQRPVMLVGNAGSAKTTVLADRLRSLPDEVLSCTINFNSFTDASALQFMLEQPLEKKTGTTYGPPGTKRLTYAT
jgi:dynein heavy chain